MFNSIKKLFKKKEITPQAVPFSGVIAVKKWVTTSNGRIAILDSYTSPGMVEIHYIGEEGQTTEAVEIDVGSLRVAFLEEIPGPRRPSLSVGIPLGYLPAPVRG